MEVNEYQDMIDSAQKTMKHAYAPYSKYHVGACVKMKDGQLFCGANVENASYGLTSCAERNALFTAYSFGYRKEDIAAMLIMSDGKRLVSPCGACRQVMVELLEKNTPIMLYNHIAQRLTTIEELLPMSFTMEDVL